MQWTATAAVIAALIVCVLSDAAAPADGLQKASEFGGEDLLPSIRALDSEELITLLRRSDDLIIVLSGASEYIIDVQVVIRGSKTLRGAGLSTSITVQGSDQTFSLLDGADLSLQNFVLRNVLTETALGPVDATDPPLVEWIDMYLTIPCDAANADILFRQLAQVYSQYWNDVELSEGPDSKSLTVFAVPRQTYDYKLPEGMHVQKVSMKNVMVSCGVLPPVSRKNAAKAATCQRRSDRGASYTGNVSTSAAGYPCLPWKDHSSNLPPSYVDASLLGSLEGSVCRNPIRRRSGVWCFTDNPDAQFDRCDVQYCDQLASPSTDLGVGGWLLISMLGALAAVLVVFIGCMAAPCRRRWQRRFPWLQRDDYRATPSARVLLCRQPQGAHPEKGAGKGSHFGVRSGGRFPDLEMAGLGSKSGVPSIEMRSAMEMTSLGDGESLRASLRAFKAESGDELLAATSSLTGDAIPIQMHTQPTSSGATSGTTARWERSPRGTGASSPPEQGPPGLGANTVRCAIQQAEARVVRRSTMVEIVDDLVTLGAMLGSGSHGQVHQGDWHGTQVAVKTMVIQCHTLAPALGGTCSEGCSLELLSSGFNIDMSRSIVNSPSCSIKGDATCLSRLEMVGDMLGTELAIGMKLQHPNVVSTYKYKIDVHVTEDHRGGAEVKVVPLDDIADSEFDHVLLLEVTMLMELCEGGNLKSALHRRPFMVHHPEIRGAQLRMNGPILRMLMQAAAGMLHLHAEGIIHSDLKPENILLKAAPEAGLGESLPGGPTYLAKVADFGLSLKPCAAQAGAPLPVRGTMGYIAPEVLLHNRLGAESDVFSFGMVMYHCFVGDNPLSSMSLLQVSQIHRSDTLKETLDLSRTAQTMLPAVADLLCRCISSDFEARPTFKQIHKELGVLVELHGHVSGSGRGTELGNPMWQPLGFSPQPVFSQACPELPQFAPEAGGRQLTGLEAGWPPEECGPASSPGMSVHSPIALHHTSPMLDSGLAGFNVHQNEMQFGHDSDCCSVTSSDGSGSEDWATWRTHLPGP